MLIHWLVSKRFTFSDIAKCCNVHRSTVSRWYQGSYPTRLSLEALRMLSLINFHPIVRELYFENASSSDPYTSLLDFYGHWISGNIENCPDYARTYANFSYLARPLCSQPVVLDTTDLNGG